MLLNSHVTIPYVVNYVTHGHTLYATLGRNLWGADLHGIECGNANPAMKIAYLSLLILDLSEI